MKIGVYGNGLDSVFTCYELLAEGHHVTHFTGGSKIGGHFAGSMTDHGIVDLGMMLLENDGRNTTQKSISKFSNEFGVNAREYLDECYAFLEKSLGNLRPRKVKTRLDNNVEVADYFISDNLEVFKTLKDEEIISLEARLTSVARNREPCFIHPRLKDQNEDRIDDDLRTQLEIQYGPELSDRLFGSFIRALVGARNAALPFRFHRKLWIPLYFPETILSAIRGVDNPLPELKFLEFVDGSVASNIQKLIEEILGNNRYSVNALKYEDLSLEKNSIEYQIFLTSIAELSRLLKSKKVETYANSIESKIVKGPGALITVLHLCVEKIENKTVMLQSPINNLFRYSITNGIGKNQSCVSFEFSDIGDLTVDHLFSIVQRLEPKVKKICNGELKTIPFSTKYLDLSLSEWNTLCNDLTRELTWENCRFLLIHPDGTSFNDNLVRGLAGSRGVKFKSGQS